MKLLAYSGMPLARLEVAMTQLQAMPNPTRFGHEGFTLVEMMVVGAIIGLVSLLAVPNYLAMVSRHELRTSVTELRNQLVLARMAAMNRNVSVNTAVTLGNGYFNISVTNAAGTQVFLAGQSIMNPHITNMLTGTPLTQTAMANIAFTSRGFRLGGGVGDQQIALVNDRGDQYSVRVTPRGLIEWCAKAQCP